MFSNRPYWFGDNNWFGGDDDDDWFGDDDDNWFGGDDDDLIDVSVFLVPTI